MPPFGHLTPLRVFIDPDLLQYDEVWAAAGTWHDVFAIAPGDLVQASGSTVTDLNRADGWRTRTNCRSSKMSEAWTSGRSVDYCELVRASGGAVTVLKRT